MRIAPGNVLSEHEEAFYVPCVEFAVGRPEQVVLSGFGIYAHVLPK
jgi:hypothetical protein